MGLCALTLVNINKNTDGKPSVFLYLKNTVETDRTLPLFPDTKRTKNIREQIIRGKLAGNFT